MKNNEVAKKFVDGDYEEDLKGSNLFIKGDAIYSFGTHFPIALRLKNNVFLINCEGFSPTTTRHKNYVLRLIESNKENRIIMIDKRKLIDAINDGVTEYKEMIVDKIIDSEEIGTNYSTEELVKELKRVNNTQLKGGRKHNEMD